MKNFLKSLAYLGFYFVVQFVMQMIFMLFGRISGMHSQEGLMEFSMNHLLLMTLVSNAVTLILFTVFLKIRKKCIKEEWELAAVGMKAYIAPCLSICLISFCWAFATYNVSFANAEQIEKSVVFYSGICPGLGTVLMAFSLLVAQPVMEEVLCRGIMLNTLKKSMPAWCAVLISALLFGVMHLMAGGVLLTIGAALIGIWLGIIFVKTRSLYVAVVAHAFANLPDFILSYVPELENGIRIALAAACALLSIVILVFTIKKKNENG